MKEEDQKLLDEILVTIRDEINQLVTNRLELFRQEVRSFFPGPWPIVEDRIEKAREQIKDVTWEYLEGVGLVRRPLRFKRDLLHKENAVFHQYRPACREVFPIWRNTAAGFHG